MKYTFTKISFISAFISLFLSCNAVKHVPEEQYLLTENIIYVDSVKITDAGVYSQLSQKPNPSIPFVGIPFGLHVYNMADLNPEQTFENWLHKKPNREERLVRFLSKKQVDGMDSIYSGFNRWLMKSGDEPVIISDLKTMRSKERLQRWYASYGYFNNEVSHKVIPHKNKEKRAKLAFNVITNKPYIIGDTIHHNIESPVVDSIFQENLHRSFIKPKKQYNAADFVNERDRLTILLRNSGLYHFDEDYVLFEADTVNTNHKANISLIIPNRKITTSDSTYTVPFQAYKIDKVRIVTDYTASTQNMQFQDSVRYQGYDIFSYKKMRYRPKALIDAISIAPGDLYKDIDLSLTYRQINDLRIFKYPNIVYTEKEGDTIGHLLDATILLTPQDLFTLGADFDSFTSTIQDFGISFSGNMMFKNVFRGAEILQLTGRGSFGSSKDAAHRSDNFFNISELGADAKLTFPRILLPFNTQRWIPKYMSPNTSFSIGMSAQNNIGLDRRTLNGILTYSWKPSRTVNYYVDLLNLQYVRNLNRENYFNVYRNSYNQLNIIARQTELTNQGSVNPDYYTIDDNRFLHLTIPEGAEGFMDDVRDGTINPYWDGGNPVQAIDNIYERKKRLTENNLIFASNITFVKDTRRNIKYKSFTQTRVKLETAGNALTGLASLTGTSRSSNGNYEIFNVAYSQYIKGEVELIKHWEIDENNILAFRGFTGLAIPYGNSNSIPFTRSYFGGGVNDNRGWRAFDLGPGSSADKDEFNEANFKVALNLEYRFTVLGSFKGALFIDSGNIWDVENNITEEAAIFNTLEDFKEMAVATGFGLRYDWGFFVLRFDIGFKTHNPARPEGERWFKEYNFKHAVYNIGINYPF
ncbi:MAG: BamA/TamA family outer membrane protein [Bacteroidetes bacterium]|nr:BamA/TamA family outer membrane protein [Bacteroidota bacterium]